MGQTATHGHRRGPGGAPPPDRRPVFVLDIDSTLLEALGHDLPAPELYTLYRPTDETLDGPGEVVCCSVGLPPPCAAEDPLRAAPPPGEESDDPHARALRLWGRPGLPLFLRQLAASGDVAVWSMGAEPYVRLVCDRVLSPLLGPDRELLAALHRGDSERCAADPATAPYLKNLDYLARRLNRPTEHLVIVEDTPSNVPQWQNLIAVPPFLAHHPAAHRDRILHQLVLARRAGRGTKRDAEGRAQPLRLSLEHPPPL